MYPGGVKNPLLVACIRSIEQYFVFKVKVNFTSWRLNFRRKYRINVKIKWTSDYKSLHLISQYFRKRSF